MKSFFSRRIVESITLGVVIGGAFVAGYFSGYRNIPELLKVGAGISHTETAVETTADFEPFWKAWNILKDKYVGEGITDQERVWGSIEGLAAAYGDPYTTFLPPQESEAFQEDISGEFSGVGMEIALRDGILTVVAPLKGTPAYKAGVLSGDKIVEIEGKSTQGMSVEGAIGRIRGERGTPVQLTLYRKDATEPLHVEIIRDVIQVPIIETEEKDGVFVIHFYTFTATSPLLFRNALQEFVASNTRKLVLDLRGNPGGYLDAAVDIASWFLPRGKVIVKEDFGDGKGDEFRSKGYDIFSDSPIDMVILIDSGSASASEILAGALREHGVARLVGVRSFGKGSVQELVPVTDKTSLKITIARWLTPEGVSISDNGVMPDIEVLYDPKAREEGKDNQLETAIRALQ